MSAPLALQFLQSASKHHQLPDSSAEVAMIGRSNVGKSSLINALAQRTKLARTSKTPGATQLLNIYELGEASGRWVVDLPGYGFAKLSNNRRSEMAAMINSYLAERESLSAALLLIDANVGPTELDLQTADWLTHIDLPFEIVGTKVDKIKPSQRGKKQKTSAERLGVKSGAVHWVSAHKGVGLPELRGRIDQLLHAPAPPLDE